jgi:hypothetical protein
VLAALGTTTTLLGLYDCGTALAAIHRVAGDLGWDAQCAPTPRRRSVSQSSLDGEPDEMELIHGTS